MIHLFFADNKLLFLEPDDIAILSIRCVLLSFYAVLGLNTNLVKSELVSLGGNIENKILIRILGCSFSKLY